jgi:hypothetical protein
VRAIPSMRSLMEDPLFRQYMKKPPRLPMNLRTGNPYQLWVRRENGNWGTTLRPTYADAWRVFLHHYKAGDRDVTLMSRRVFFAPPGEWYRVKIRLDKARVSPSTGEVTTHRLEWRWRQLFFWDDTDLHWCGRCRRPVYWQPLYEGHHAIRRMVAFTEEDNYRCNICGIRYVATPLIEHMEKMERRPE